MKTVLIIEDNEDNMELCKMVLDGKFNVISAFNGNDGLEQIRSKKPDVVLLDLSLPGINGIDIAKRAKASEETKHIPLIALTAHGMEKDKELAINAGCSEFVEKPFEIKHLIDVINKHISTNSER